MAQKQQNAQVSQSPILPVILTSEDGITYSGTPTQAGWNATAVGSNALINGVAGQKYRVVAMLAITSVSPTLASAGVYVTPSNTGFVVGTAGPMPVSATFNFFYSALGITG